MQPRHKPPVASALSLLIVFCYALQSIAQGENPDVIEKQISRAFDSKDYQHIVELMRQRKALGGHIPPPLFYIEANAYYQLGNKAAALQALNSYFPQANHAEYPYNEAVDLAARVKDEVYDSDRRETSISWDGAADSGQTLRRGHIDIAGKRASLIGVTLECTYAGATTQGGTVTGMPAGWDYYVKLYQDAPDDNRHLPISTFPNDVPVAEIIRKRALLLTMHLLTGDSLGRFPDNVRPPWDGWYDWSEKRWHGFVQREPAGVTLWDRKRGTGPFGSADRFNDILSATYWQERHWNREYSLKYLDSYRITFPSMETVQTVSLGEKFSQGPGDPGFCQLFGNACQTLRTTVMNRFSELQPSECTPRPYREPEQLSEAVRAAQ